MPDKCLFLMVFGSLFVDYDINDLKNYHCQTVKPLKCDLATFPIYISGIPLIITRKPFYIDQITVSESAPMHR